MSTAISALIALFTSCAAPCLPFSTPAHEVSCDGGVVIATFNAQHNNVLAPSCTVHVDGGVAVAMVSGVVCPGEQFERLSNQLTLNCALADADAGASICR